MASIGTFHKTDDGTYTGAIKTLNLNVKQAVFRPSATENDKAPDYRIFSGKSEVAVDVSSVIRASPSSFRASWIERRYENGALSSTEHWTAILSVVLQPPRSVDSLMKNPLGVYVDALNWSKELG